MTDVTLDHDIVIDRTGLVRSWLFGVAGLIFLMVIVGGATRLTESGLSMTDWRPITGVVPPLTETEWQAEFSKYQQSPEYKIVNKGMSVEAFKTIFYWEWGHRLLGRVIGLAYGIPLMIFWALGWIPKGYKPRLFLLLVLGGGQGLLGWYMVQSGLVDEPAVSHYRLVAHLSLALTLFSAVLWTGFDLLNRKKTPVTPVTRGIALALVPMIALQIIMGGLVAGLDAGAVVTDWPTMNGALVPEGLGGLDPWYLNPLDNQMTVHFDHRIGAYCLAFLVGLLVWRAVRTEARLVKQSAILLGGLTVMQIIFGIVTVLMAVPVFWGATHQGGGVLVLAAILWMAHHTRAASNKENV